TAFFSRSKITWPLMGSEPCFWPSTFGSKYSTLPNCSEAYSCPASAEHNKAARKTEMILLVLIDEPCADANFPSSLMIASPRFEFPSPEISSLGPLVPAERMARAKSINRPPFNASDKLRHDRDGAGCRELSAGLFSSSQACQENAPGALPLRASLPPYN